ncbi:MAG: ATP-dependent metallopeptidase FtsH/Yme1/Tma family protein [Deltaproteobacteria bacterium]|nr:ATP-dependent metallopeptidase FtsH/Yme1/Tma family protein [Deltaproteobacteria bacterium]
MRQTHKTVALWLLLALMSVSVYHIVFGSQAESATERTFSDVLVAVDEGKVKTLTIKGQGTAGTSIFQGTMKDGGTFRSTGVLSDNIMDRLDKAKVPYKIEREEGNNFWVYALNVLPMLLLFVIFLLFMRQLQAGGGKAMSFGKSRARLLGENSNKVTFADVAGVDEAKDELEEIVHFLKDPKKFTRLGGRIPKGVLLMGNPGTGKTLLAKAIAGEAGVPFFSISGSDFVEMFVGVGASRVRDLFEQGKKHAPCIIFVDEIDAVGRHRGAGLGGGHDEREQTLNQLLVEMDGFEANEGVIIIAATNRPDVLDPALLRPGRFDRRVVVPLPDLKGREEIFRVHTRKVLLGPDVDLAVLSRGTPGLSGADIENIVNEAALIAARQDKPRVEMRDFESAKDKIFMGTERKSMIMSEKEKKSTAYHEAGHALVSIKGEGERDPVHKITIIPRGRALGVTRFLPEEDRHTYSKEYAENILVRAMGGRVAEMMVFGQLNNGAGSDIESATRIARAMVCEWGMSEKLGPLAYGQKEGDVFLGRDWARAADYSDATAQQIDEEVRRLVTLGYERALKILSDNRELLDRMATALFEYETLDADDVKILVDGKDLQRERPTMKVRTREQFMADQKAKALETAKPPSGGILGGPGVPEPGKA